MERIQTPDATASHQFTDGDSTAGTPATTVDATWLNQVQEELCEVVEYSGAILDGTKTNQLLQAIGNIFHPIGLEFFFGIDFNPNQQWPWQTWTEIADGHLQVSRDTNQNEFKTTGQTGGAKTHTLSAAELPLVTSGLPIQHDASVEADDTVVAQAATAFSLLQPYRVGRLWRRTA